MVVEVVAAIQYTPILGPLHLDAAYTALHNMAYIHFLELMLYVPQALLDVLTHECLYDTHPAVRTTYLTVHPIALVYVIIIQFHNFTTQLAY